MGGFETGLAVPGLLHGAARLLAFAALAVLVGAALFVAAWWPGGARHPALRRLLWSSWAVLVGATVAVLLLFGPHIAARPLSDVLDTRLLSATLETRMGAALLGRVLVLSLAAPALAVLLSRTGALTRGQRAGRIGGVLGGAAALASTWSIAGHAAVGRQTVLAVAVDVVHLGAMSVWLGGLVVLSGILLRTAEIEAMRRAVPAFSRAAMICVAVLVGTGAYQSWREVGTPTALVSTSYGWLLMGKVLLVGLLVGIGAASRSWVRNHYAVPVSSPVSSPAAGPQRSGPGGPQVVRFRRMVGAEAGIAALVLGVTAALVTSQPARAEQLAVAAQQRAEQVRAAAPATAAVPAEQWPTPVTARIGFDTGGPDGPGTVDLVVFPAAVGSNQIHLSVLTGAGAFLDVPGAAVTLDLPEHAIGPLPVSVRRLGPGHYTATADIPRSGQWRLAVTVRISETGQRTVTTPIDVR
jgi:copper transport protein